MADEKLILEFRNFYKQLLPIIGSRYTITRSLETYLKQLFPFLESMSKQEYIREGELRSLRVELDAFIKKSFPPQVFKLYDNPPPIQHRITASTGSLGSDVALQLILDRLSKIGQRHSDIKIHELTYEYNFIYKIYNCLKDYGLHNEIQKRDPINSMRYNVIIEHGTDKKNRETESMQLITLEKLNKCFIEPYHNEKPILINGVRIPAKNNKRTTITTTLLKDEEIELFKAKNNSRTGIDFAKHCKDETNRLLDEMQIKEKNEPLDVNEVPFVADLINNPNLSHIVLDAYYSLVPQPTSRSQVPTYYSGDLKHHNQPFQMKVYGAFPLMIDWNFQRHKIDDGYFSNLGIAQAEVESYLKKYGQAFLEGYNSFEDDLFKVKKLVFQETSDKEQAIFDYATNWFLNRSGFPEAHGPKTHLLSAWPDAGKQAGYFYRAWYIILQQSHRFEHRFAKAYQLKDDFLDKFIEGIAELQVQDTAHHFIRQLKSKRQKDEGAFRTWFQTWFKAAGYESVDAEPLKGNGRIDLKIVDTKIGKKIIEFKGWWNKDRHDIPEQVTGYLTDFDKIGYILMVNHLKTSDIVLPYQKMIESPQTGYIPGTFKELKHPNTHFAYFVSEHKLGNRSKTLYHLIYRLFP